MKKLSILFLIVLAFPYMLKAQPGPNDVRADVTTPKGSMVIAWILAEVPFNTRSADDMFYTSAYPDATPIITYDGLSSTAKFNCHGYAWLRSVDGTDRWIGTGWGLPWEIDDPETIYMTDGSYKEVPEWEYPGKVYWGGYGEDHSAVTTSEPDIVISKWNAWPLMRHHKDYSPFGPSRDYKYYIKASEFPEHCNNCRQDADEVSLDCGGSCPPCGDAPPKRTIGAYNLQQENYAFEDISTTGNLYLWGRTVFKAGNEIVFNRGFEVEAGTEFTAQITANRDELTRVFRKTCVDIPNLFTPGDGNGIDDMYGIHVAGITHVEIVIYNRWGRSVREYSVNVSEDGFIPLWDGTNFRNGKDVADGVYYYIMDLRNFEGHTGEYSGSITKL
ncbi:MAG: gliding motility-associated C-terminal domain-containing protein [Bacteroidales bacterium]|jgi:hypothetical protein|nr:gliding motility-associated C-terminal domain-containing protein [Bacteroidales bacterium]